MPDVVVEFPGRRKASWTELSTYRQCPHKWDLQYKQKWYTDKVAVPLKTGIQWHELMDLHYTGIKGTGRADIEAVLEWFKAHDANNPENPEYDILQTLLWMYDGYRKLYGEREPTWKIVQSETEMEFDLVVVLDGYEFKMRGRIDLLIEMNGVLWVVDHKSGKQLPTNKELDLDDQTPIYIKGLREMGIPVRGALFNNAKTYRTKKLQALSDRFSREWTYRTDYELDEVMREAAEDLTTAHRPDVPNPRHPDTQQCKWRCQYKDSCIGGRKGPHIEQALLEAKGFVQG